ncbi:hypothetical protein VTI74DRAFT_6766 [Chaetomium olivicolor]
MSNSTTNIANRIEISATVQEACAQSARRDRDENTMWQSAWRMMVSINARFSSAPLAPDLAILDIDIHDLWHTGERLRAMSSAGGLLWTDPPFLVEEMTTHWVNDCAAMISSQRLSGAQFLALLAAAGAAADVALCGIALVVLREALEAPGRSAV